MTERGSMLDPTGRIIVELRSDAAIAAFVPGGVPVYGGEVHKDAAAPFYLVRRLGPNRRKPRAPMATFRIVVDAFGRTWPEAATLAGLASDVLSAKGPRRSAGGLAIYLSVEEVGPQPSLDPDSEEPVERTIYSYSAALAQAGP